MSKYLKVKIKEPHIREKAGLYAAKNKLFIIWKRWFRALDKHPDDEKEHQIHRTTPYNPGVQCLLYHYTNTRQSPRYYTLKCK